MVHVDIFIPNQVSNGRKCLEITRVNYSVGESPQSLGLVSQAKEKPYPESPWIVDDTASLCKGGDSHPGVQFSFIW